VVVERVGAEAVRPLRHAVLRPGRPFATTAFRGDDDPATFHVAAREAPGGPIVGVATIAPEPHPRAAAAGDWRLRGMATAEAVRGRGVGAALLRACVEHARAAGGRRVWCTARTPAEGFYAAAGFVTEGAPFEVAGIGPHVVMALGLAPAAAGPGVRR